VAETNARIYVAAGVNGAGKSSIRGAIVRASGADYFNPDEAARAVRAADPRLSVTEANALAWQRGSRLLTRAIAERRLFAFETTLGGSTITALLDKAIAAGIEVDVWYAGLASPEMHLARVKARVAGGGHDIPEADIRRRYDASRLNLIRLMPRLAALRVYDNSAEADPTAGRAPEPVLLLHMERGKVVATCPFGEVPDWAKPILAAAMKL
jgi:predicted ABC-type ATPase